MTIAKRITTIALAATVVGAWSAATAADKSRATNVDKPAETRTESGVRDDRRDMRPHPGGLVEAKWLLGAKLHDADGKDLGKIEEFWIDPKTGQIKEAIVTIGATMGVGGKDKVVSWNDLKINWKDQKVHVSVDPKAIRDAYQTKMDREDRGPAASPRTNEKKR
jgi:sporulation protein YlmC with PRC-barrel domain